MNLLPFLRQLFNQPATAPLAAGCLSEATIWQAVGLVGQPPQVPVARD